MVKVVCFVALLQVLIVSGLAVGDDGPTRAGVSSPMGGHGEDLRLQSVYTGENSTSICLRSSYFLVLDRGTRGQRPQGSADSALRYRLCLGGPLRSNS